MHSTLIEVAVVVALGCGISVQATTNYPTAVVHGMGDSCFNGGMKSITTLIGQVTNQNATCIPTGDNWLKDTMNGYFMTMNDNVEVFAQKVRSNPIFANGFNCVGFSQGNMLCRGYIQKYNDPPVINWLSVHGTVMGVAGFPKCNPDGLLGPVCKFVANMTGDAAMLVQNDLFQADYFRDPFTVEKENYKKNSELAQWNNEGMNEKNTTFNINFNKTKKFAMIKANKDTMIFPNDSEWWGFFKDDSLTEKFTMKDAPWYVDDWFGLRAADEAGKILFNSTDGNHLQFSEDQLTWWIQNYFEE